MADLTITINPPVVNSITISEGNPCNSITISDGTIPHNNTHAPSGSDSLETWYATLGNLTYVSGLTELPSGIVYTTGNQDISGVKNFYSRPTVNGSGVMLSGEIAGTGYLTGYVQISQTGQFYPLSNPSGYITGVNLSNYATISYSTGISGHLQGQIASLNSSTGSYAISSNTGAFLTTGAADSRYALQSATGNFVTSGNTGNFVTSTQTGQLTGVFYPYSANPAAYVQGAVVRPSNTGNFMDRVSNQTIGGTKTFTGTVLLGASAANQGVPALVCENNGFFTFSGVGGGSFSESALIRAVNHTNDNNVSTSYISMDCGGGEGVSISGESISLYGSTIFDNRPTFNGTGFLLSGEVTTPSTGYLTGYVQKTETGAFTSSGQTGQFYPASNPSGFASTAFVTGISGYQNSQTSSLQSATGNLNARLVSVEGVTGSFVLSSNTGNFVTSSQTGSFYPRSNPSGYITSVDLSPYASTSSVTGISGHLQGQITALNSATGSYVITSQTGNFVAVTSTGALLTTGAADNRYALQSSTGNFAINSSVVLLTGNQNISGVKNFISRPTVAGTGILLSGESITTQPNDANIIIGLSIFL